MTGVGRNCFPVRSLTKSVSTKVNTKDEGGAWLVAYKAEQRRRFKAVLCCDKKIPTSQKPVKRRLKSTPQDENNRKKLDGFYLMTKLHVNDPRDLCSINICDQALTQVNEDDFPLFENVMHIDAGENNLDLTHFVKFPNLRELELPLNNIGGDISLNDGYYKGLEKLDLSCNHLTNNDINELGILPELKQLHLTGNHLKQLPYEMSRSYFTDEGHRKARFPKLEKLWLDQNDLMESNTFSCLAGLKRLKYLNLENNKISCVPSLKLLDPNNELNTDYLSPNDEYNDDDQEEQSTTMIDKMVDEQLNNVNKQISNLEDVLCNNNDQYNSINHQHDMNDKTFTYYYDSYIQRSQPLPFLSLEHLNLANNYVENEEDLLALSTWTSLKELIIWGNPVATRGKEGPAIVNYRLGLIAGINVARRKPSPKPKYHLALSQLKKNPRKVDDLPPLIHSKKLLMLEEPKYADINHSNKSCSDMKPLPPITAPCQNNEELVEPMPKRSFSAPVGQRHQNSNHSQELRSESQATTATTTTTEKQSNKEETSEERVFLTQIDDNEETQGYNTDDSDNNDVQQTTTTTTTTKKSKPTNMKIPEKYKGYEELLNIDETFIDDIKLPKGIHSNAMALQYILKHPLIFTDNTTTPRNRTKQEDKITTKNQDSPTTVVEELGAVLEKMRTHSNTVESNLGDLLNNTDYRPKKEIKQARKLLKQVQTKYDEVRSESLRSTALTSELPSHLKNILKPNK